MAKQNQEGITVKKEDNFTEWFVQIMKKADLADYSKVSGCIVFKPASWGIWEKVKEETDKEFKKIGLKNAQFPLFIPESLLTKEEEHVEGFAPEVAWVDYGGNTKLGERLAIRPTSEAIIYDSYSQWIRSWRDLPLLLNQWCNVVRWEFNNPVPFFRTREFHWNEVHSVFANEKEAVKHGQDTMKAYNKITEDFMALPGIYGRKTEKEKFAGAVFTEKMHHYVAGGKIIEGTCFHYDGENFAKAYDIKFLDKDGKEKFAHQNTHAISTRMLGAMFAMHSDNKGLVLPPKMALNKVVIIPLLFKGKEKAVLDEAKKLQKSLSKFEPILDDREDYSPGWKFNEWELKGVPIRIEIGPRDLEEGVAILKTRIGEEKLSLKLDEIKDKIPTLLSEMQETLYKNAEVLLKENTKETEDKKELIKLIKEKQMVKSPFCNKAECEEAIKHETKGAKVVFIDPENPSVKGKKCIACGNDADYMVYIGKTY